MQASSLGYYQYSIQYKLLFVKCFFRETENGYSYNC